MRVFTGSLSCETNTFSPIPTGLSAFHERVYYKAGQHPAYMLHCAGPLWALRQSARIRGWHVVEGLVASAMPGGITTRHAYESLRDELLEDLRLALPVDMVLLGLHGAMVADGYSDCEGDLLERIRHMVGPKTVIGAVLDPHCHMSGTMLENANVLICFKEYPHTDVLARSEELVELCAMAAQGRVKPVPCVADCRMIAILHTTREPIRGFVDHIRQLERQEGVLSISIVHGFPWGDVPDMGTKVLVYTDADQCLSNELASGLAASLSRVCREQLSIPLDVDKSIEQALAVREGPVVLADSADNPGGGAPGDSTFILRQLINRHVPNSAVGPLWDPMAVKVAFEAGVGAHIVMRIGGKTSVTSGDPIDAECQVVALCREMVMTGLAGMQAPLGDSALVRIGGVEVVITSIRCQALNIDLFTQLGCDVRGKHIVVVKSSQHFHESFAQIASEILYVDSPGALSTSFHRLAYRHITRPKWPIQ